MSPARHLRKKEARHGRLARRRALPLTLVALASVAASSASAAQDATSAAAAGHATTTSSASAPSPQWPYRTPGSVSGSSGDGQRPGAVTIAARGDHSVGAAAARVEQAATLTENGIPAVALAAYRTAAARLAQDNAGCGLSWSVLAAIGRVESNHGQFGGATLLPDGRSNPPILGPRLDGRNGFALIPDTDGGLLDGDPTYDRAIGPMQFIPSTWVSFAVDGNGDGKADPYNINDAALAAGLYLCAAGGDLSTPAGLQKAIFSYNHSTAYVQLVTALAEAYQSGNPAANLPLPVTPGASTSPLPVPPAPEQPATVGPPLAVPGLSASPAAGGTTPSAVASPSGAASSTAAPTTTAGSMRPSTSALPVATATVTTAPATTSASPTTAAPTTPPATSPVTTPASTCQADPSASASGAPTPSPEPTPSAAPTPAQTAATTTETGTPTASDTPSPTATC